MPRRKTARVCCLTVDADPLDVYYHNRGLVPGEKANVEAVYQDGLPRWRELLKRLGIKATFFVTGKEAAAAQNREILAALVADGHELANHSFCHPADFADLDEKRLLEEIAGAEKVISDIVGGPVLGFRAPGWNVNHELFRVLEERGYRYESSLMPLCGYRRLLGAFRLAERLSAGRLLDGQVHWSLSRQSPYRIVPQRPRVPGKSGLVEVPCGFCRCPPCPLNFTAAVWLGQSLYRLLAQAATISWAPLVFIAHGIDLVDFEKQIADERLVRKPGLARPMSEKLKLMESILGILGRGRHWVTAAELALTACD